MLGSAQDSYHKSISLILLTTHQKQSFFSFFEAGSCYEALSGLELVVQIRPLSSELTLSSPNSVLNTSFMPGLYLSILQTGELVAS